MNPGHPDEPDMDPDGIWRAMPYRLTILDGSTLNISLAGACTPRSLLVREEAKMLRVGGLEIIDASTGEPLSEYAPLSVGAHVQLKRRTR
jgi:hypothetical protein